MIEVLCEDCREAFPSNQTTVITVGRVTSRRQTTRLYRGTRGGIGFGGSSGITTSYRDRTVCFECLHYRAEEIRRANRRRAFRWLLAIVIGASFFVWASSHHVFAPSNSGSTTNYSDDTASNLPAAAAPPEVVNEPTDSDAPSSTENSATMTEGQSDQLPADAAGPVPLPVADESVRSFQNDQNRQATLEIDDAISDATRIALKTGEAVRWHKNGQKGFVIVSQPTVSGDKTCRNVAWTDKLSRSDDIPWCSIGGSEWAPQR